MSNNLLSDLSFRNRALYILKYALNYRHSGRRKVSSPKLDNKIVKKFIKMKYE